MQILDSEAIVLRLQPLQEQDEIVTLLSGEHGKKRVVAAGSRKKFSRFRGHLQLLSWVRVGWAEKDSWQLGRLRDVETVLSADCVLGSLESVLVASYIAEMVEEMTSDNEPAEHFVRLLRAGVECLREGFDPDALCRYFELWTLRLSGVFPPLDACPECGRERFEGGAVMPARETHLLCRQCHPERRSGDVEVPLEVFTYLQQLIRHSPRDAMSLAVTPGQAAGAERLCSAVRREYLGRELRSYEVLHRTMARVRPMGPPG